MLITADQLLAHAIGDYILQSDWMAQNKTKRIWPAAIHALTYSLVFLFFHPSLLAWYVIFGTHWLIDHCRLARYVVWAKNWMAPRGSVPPRWDGQEQKAYPRRNWPWSDCRETGYAPNSPAWLSVWLLIIADNILHVLINGIALRYL